MVYSLIPLGMMIRRQRVGLEADIVWEGTIEVAFDEVAVGFAEFAFVCLFH